MRTLSASVLSTSIFALGALAGQRLTGPYTHENLSVYLVHGDGAKPGAKKYLPLEQAIEKKAVVVHETGNVNQLSIENVSADTDVFVQSGDIVKGGQQDRALVTDLILPPKSGKIPISAFCVEEGRWSKRGNEAVQNFNASANQVTTKELKLAVKGKDQSKVWAEVAKARAGLGVAAGAATGTSMQLALEDGRVTKSLVGYRKALSALPRRHPDAIGFAYAVNGEINSADVYATPELFAAMWPKLLESSAAEAVAKSAVKDKKPAPAARAIDTFLNAPVAAAESKATHPNKRTKVATKEDGKILLTEAEDAGHGAVVHRSYVAK